MTLFARLTVLVSVALLPAIAIQANNEIDLRRSRLAEARDDTTRHAELLASDLARILDGARQLVAALSQVSSVRDFDEDACHDLMERLRAQFPHYVLIDAADIRGQGRCAGAPGHRLSVADRAWFRLAVENDGFAIGEYVVGRQSGRPSLHISTPIHDPDGTVIGVVGAALDLDWLGRYLVAKPLPPGMAFAVADRNGTVLAREPDGERWVGKPVPPHFMALLTAPRPGTVEMPGIDGDDRVISYLPLGTEPVGLSITVGMSRAAAFADVDRATVRGLLLIAAGWGLALLCAWIVARRFLLRPVGALAGAVERWTHGDLTARTGLHDRRDELGALGRAFDEMADALAQQEQRFRIMADGIPQLAWMARPDRGIFWFNQRWYDFTGTTFEEMEGWGWRSIHHPDHLERVVARFQRSWETGEPWEDTFPMRRKDGQYRWFLSRALPVRDAQGDVLWFGTNTDVTEQLAAEEALRVSESRYRGLVERQSDIVLRLSSADGSLTFVNDTAARVLGLTREEVTGQPWHRFVHPDTIAATVEAIACALLPPERRATVENLLLTVDGPRWYTWDGYGIVDESGSFAEVQAVGRDITLRKAMEDDLAAAKEEAERANLAKSKFLAAAAHDLRQPLQSLFFFAEALRSDLSTERGRDKLLHLQRGLDALKDLLESLLDVSRLDAGIVQPQVQEFPLTDLLDHLGSAYAPIAAGKGLGWRVSTCPMRVRSDRNLLGRMLRNLIENALRYTEKGGIAITCQPHGDTLLIAVEDTGIGIPQDHVSLIWEEFHQVGNPERDRAQGLGLGLAIVKRLGELLGHKVDLRSAAGRGSVFTVTVPLVAADPVSLPAAAATSEVDEPDSGAGRFAVVVDDDAIVLMGLKSMLEEWGYEVLIAPSTDTMVERLQAASRVPDVIVADYRLRQGRIGTEAILTLRRLYGTDVPGMILTGEIGPEAQRDAARHGFGLIHKPVTPRQLVAALERQLRAAE
ncbi:PAS domain S-box protein [Azospirillum sp. sgz301742]